MFLVQTLNSVKFQQLAIFICHLLLGGQFQLVQIFYDSASIDFQLFREIQSKCLSEISWTTIEIGRPGIPDWNQTVKSDYFIQLIFADGDVSQLSSSFKPPSNYYRLFIFQSNGTVSTAPKLSNKTKIDSKSNSVGLFHNVTGAIEAHLLHDDLTIFHKPINFQNLNEPISSAQVFDKVFGEREQLRSLGVFDPNIYCERPFYKFVVTLIDLYSRSLRKYFFKQMKMDFFEMGIGRCESENGQYFRVNTERIYEELEWDIEPIDNDPTGRKLSFDNDSNLFFINEYSTQNQNTTNLNFFALSTVSVTKTHVAFVYLGNSLISMAPQNFWLIFGSVWIQIFFILCATIMLYFLRLGDLKRRVELITAYVDVMIAVTGGQNLQYRDKFEKIFFGILFLGAFFINAIGIDNFLFAVFMTQTPDHVDTFEKMLIHNPPVLNYDLKMDDPILHNISQKLGPSVKIANWTADAQFSYSSFALIADDYFFIGLADVLELSSYVVDKFPENFGDIHHHYYLSYDTFIPRNLTKRFERATQNMMENGLERFYWTFARFKGRWKFTILAMNEEMDEPEELGLERCFFLFGIYMIQISIATISFIIELIVHRIKMKRNQQIETAFI